MKKGSTVKIFLDIVLAVALLVLMEPKITGLEPHERLGLLICVGFLIHNLLNRKWIACATRGFFKQLSAKTRVNYVVDWLLFIGMFLVVLSGMEIAKTIDFSWLPFSENRGLWRGVHGSAAMLMFAAVGVHIGLHWNWMLRRFRSNEEAAHD